MPVRQEDIAWSTPQDLLGNKPFNSNPYATGLTVTGSALESRRRKGNALYTYDFGGIGQIGELTWDGVDYVSFRYKIADTNVALLSTEFVGTTRYSFKGSQLDPVWFIEQADLSTRQNNELILEGTVTFPKAFTQEARLSLQTTKEQPLAFVAKMSIDRTKASGAISYLAVADGQNTLEVQKVFQAVRNPAKDVQGEYQAVNTNTRNQAVVEVVRDGTIIALRNANKTTDGVYEKIDFTDIRTARTDTLVHLKQYAFLTDLSTEATSYGISAEAIPFRARSDYQPSLLEFKQYLHYDIARDIGFYRATVPITHRDIDLYESKITSWNWDGKKWILSDTDNVWKLAVTLPPGIYRYNFWIDGKEIPDSTNPRTYYLDANNQKHLITEGYGSSGYGSAVDLTGKIVFSELIVEFAQTIEFVYPGVAKQAALVGSFNDYDPTRHPMVQQVDRQLIRRLADPNFIYTNNNPDYHRIDIELPSATSLQKIDFKTLVLRERKQRVKIFLDDKPVTQYDWNLTKAGPDTGIISRSSLGYEVEPHFAYGYGYGSLVSGTLGGNSFSYGSFYGYGYGVDIGYGYCGNVTYGQGEGASLAICDLTNTCGGNNEASFSYWDNNTDTIVASEDGVIRWCLKEGQERLVKKISFHSRVEAGDPMRQHVLLAIGTATTQAVSVSDYAFSDAYTEKQKSHSTSSDGLATWTLPTLDLQALKAELIPSAFDSLGNPIYGESVIVSVAESRPAIWSLNRSNWVSNSVEVLYGVSGKLDYRPLSVSSATDDHVLDIAPVTLSKERFANLGIHFKSVLLGVEIEPNMPLWARLIGGVSTFELYFYLTEQDVIANQNALGPLTARSYGTMYPADFSGPASNKANFFELTTVVHKGLTVALLVGNIIVVYEKGGRDRLFKIVQGI